MKSLLSKSVLRFGQKCIYKKLWLFQNIFQKNLRGQKNVRHTPNSVVMAHKIATLSAPFSLAAKMTTAHPRNTRQAASGCIRFGENLSANHSYFQDSFCHRASLQYNSIQASIRAVRNMMTFKMVLKQWVQTNIPLD